MAKAEGVKLKARASEPSRTRRRKDVSRVMDERKAVAVKKPIRHGRRTAVKARKQVSVSAGTLHPVGPTLSGLTPSANRGSIDSWSRGRTARRVVCRQRSR